jgi:hypothetical protein
MNQLTDAIVSNLVASELARARHKFPWWPSDMVKACAIANEENSEVVKSVNNLYWSHGSDTQADIQIEAIQAIAMLYRFLTETPDMTLRDRARNAVEQIVPHHPATPDADPYAEGDLRGTQSFGDALAVSVPDTDNDQYAAALLRQAGQAS